MSLAVRHLALPLVVAVLACGNKSGDQPADKSGAKPAAAPAGPGLTVGAFTVPVPAGWADVSSERAQPGQFGLQTTGRQPPVLLILSPAPTPMPFDPTDPAACATQGGKMPGVIGTPSVIELPAGKACAVETQGDKRTTMTVLVVGDRGLMAQCRFDSESDHGACDAIVRGVALAK